MKYFTFNSIKIRTLFRLCSPVQGVLILLIGYGCLGLCAMALLYADFLQLATVELEPYILIPEIVEVVTANQDVVLPTGNSSWANYIFKSLAITTVIVVAGPAFFPVISSSVVSAAVWGGCTVSKVLFTKAALPIICLPAIIDPIAVESIISDIPNTFNSLNRMGFHLVKMEDWLQLQRFCIGNWWGIYREMDYCFYGLMQIYLACESYPFLLKIPALIKLVSSLNLYCYDFWLLSRLFPLTFGEPSTIGEPQVVALLKKIVWIIEKLYVITRVP